MTDDDQLAQAMRLMWGKEPRRTRGPRPKLTLDEIATAAVAVAGRDGIDALSMQRVAKELGYTTMSLYNYVPSKGVLIDVMMDLASGPAPRLTGTTWRRRVEQWIEALWDLYRDNPWMVQVPIGSPPIGPRQLEWFDLLIGSLADSGLPPTRRLSSAMFLLGAVRGLARLSIESERSASSIPYDRALAEVIASGGRFPALAEIANPEVFDPEDGPGDVGVPLADGVALILDGIEEATRPRETAPPEGRPARPR